MACTGGNCGQDAAKKKGCKCVCECLPKKTEEVPGDSAPDAGSNAPVGVGEEGLSQAGASGGPSNPGSGIFTGGGGPALAIGTGHGAPAILDLGRQQSGQWVPFQGGILPTPMPGAEPMLVGGGARGSAHSSFRLDPQRPIRGDLPVLVPTPQLRSPVPDGLQAQATLAPPPGYSFESSGIAQTAKLPPPLVAPAYALRHHRAPEVPIPLPVAPPATGNFDLGGARRAANSGIGASEVPGKDDGYSRAGVWKEWTQPFLSPPIHDSMEAVDLTESRVALGVHAPTGVFLSPASVGVLEEDFVDDFTATPPDQPSTAVLDQGAAAPTGKGADPSSMALAAARRAPDKVGQRLPFTPRERSKGSGAVLHGLDRAMQGGGLHVVPSIRPSIRPSAFQKPGSGKGGGIGGAMDTKERADEVAYFVHDNLLGGALPYSDAVGDAVDEGSAEAQKLYEEASRQKEAASKNFSNPEQFNDRWREEEERRTHAKKRTEARYTTQYGELRGKDVMAADRNIGRSREARDTATGVKAATAGHKGFKNPAKAREARAKAKEAQAKAKEARKAARDAKNAAKYGTASQREAAKAKADRLAAEAKVLAAAAKKLLDDANKPPPPLKVEDCGDAAGCGTCEPACEDGQECVCHWEVPAPSADGGGGTDEGGTKGKGVKGSEKAPVGPDGAPKTDGTSKEDSKPKSPLEQLVADVEESGLAKGNSSQARFARRILRALKAFSRKDAEIGKMMEAFQRKVGRLLMQGLKPLSGSDKYQLQESLKSLLAGQVARQGLDEMASTVTGFLQEGLSASDRTRAILVGQTDRLQAKRNYVLEDGRRAVRGITAELRKEGFRSTDQVLRAFGVPERVITGKDRFIPAPRKRASELKFFAKLERERNEDSIRTHIATDLGPRPDEDVGLGMALEADRAQLLADMSTEPVEVGASLREELDALAKPTLDAMNEAAARFMAEPVVPPTGGPRLEPPRGESVPSWVSTLRGEGKSLAESDKALLSRWLAGEDARQAEASAPKHPQFAGRQSGVMDGPPDPSEKRRIAFEGIMAAHRYRMINDPEYRGHVMREAIQAGLRERESPGEMMGEALSPENLSRVQRVAQYPPAFVVGAFNAIDKATYALAQGDDWDNVREAGAQQMKRAHSLLRFERSPIPATPGVELSESLVSFMAPELLASFLAPGASAQGGEVAVGLWHKLPGGVRIKRVGDYWVKQVDPEASQLAQWWGRGNIKAQAEGLKKLGDMAPWYRDADGVIITRHAGKFEGGVANYWRTWWEGTKRLGTPMNDIFPRNIGAEGVIFDPALHPLHRAARWTLIPTTAAAAKVTADSVATTDE